MIEQRGDVSELRRSAKGDEEMLTYQWQAWKLMASMEANGKHGSIRRFKRLPRKETTSCSQICRVELERPCTPRMTGFVQSLGTQ